MISLLADYIKNCILIRKNNIDINRFFINITSMYIKFFKFYLEIIQILWILWRAFKNHNANR